LDAAGTSSIRGAWRRLGDRRVTFLSLSLLLLVWIGITQGG
jgi:hypothetical protein